LSNPDTVAEGINLLVPSSNKYQLTSLCRWTARQVLSVLLTFLSERETKLILRTKLVAQKEEELKSGNDNLMRESEFLTSDFFKKEATKDQLHKLRETLSLKHSDQADRLEDMTKALRSSHDLKTSHLMEDLTNYSKLLEDTSKGTIDGSTRNNELKQEFRVFYDAYQQEEIDFKSQMAEVECKINSLVEQKAVVDISGEKDRAVLGPLKDKLLTAQQKELNLKETLRQQAAKFEMFQGLLNESNGKFAVFKKDMERNGAQSKTLTLENAELNQKIIQLRASIAPIANENAAASESFNKIKKQIEQLTLLIEKLKT
jgi:Myosin-like coiled-coil protein